MMRASLETGHARTDSWQYFSLLLALGINARGRVSSSLAANAHTLKTQTAEAALAPILL